LSFEDAATLPCAALTAWHALFEVDPLRPGETRPRARHRGVSIFALQLAVMAGANVIVIVERRELERARALGATTTINYRKAPDWRSRARGDGGHRVDRVMEVGGPGTFQKSLAALRMGGRLSVIGILTGFTGGGDRPHPGWQPSRRRDLRRQLRNVRVDESSDRPNQCPR
jgi:NADPH:quinone reductase-like Zn-dependent oxidoreductase